MEAGTEAPRTFNRAFDAGVIVTPARLALRPREGLRTTAVDFARTSVPVCLQCSGRTVGRDATSVLSATPRILPRQSFDAFTQ